MAIFSQAEMERRQTAIRAGMTKAGVDACLLTSADNVYYATGAPLLSEWGRPMYAVLTATGEGAIIGAEIERENMARDTWGVDVLTYGDGANVHQTAINLVSRVLSSVPQPVRIGVEWDSMSVRASNYLGELLKGAELVDVGPVLMDCRIIKSPEEAELLGLAGQVAKAGANAFLEALTPGNTELAVAGHARHEMDRTLGAYGENLATSSYAYAQFGEHSLSPHLHPTGKRLRRGQVVALNVFPVIWGYCVELERTLVFGEPTEDQCRKLEVLEEAFEYGKENCLPGKQFRTLHQECCRIIEQGGFGDFIRHGTGHAHGIMVGSASREDRGEIREYNDGEFEAGMFNSVEPGFYVTGEAGYRHSDVMMIDGTGAQCITEFPVDLSL